MNVCPVNFGRTIKVNAPFQVAKHATGLINASQPQKGEENVQQQLKYIFRDTCAGKARVVAPDGKQGDIYIVSGEASKRVNYLINDRKMYIDFAKKRYSKNDSVYSAVKNSVKECFSCQLRSLIAQTAEPVELDIEYSDKKRRIKSFDYII